MDKQQAAFLDDYAHLPSEDQEAVRSYVARLAQIFREHPDLSPAERRVCLVEVAREIAHPQLVDAAEKIAGSH